MMIRKRLLDNLILNFSKEISKEFKQNAQSLDYR